MSNARRNALLISVGGGKGGVGKSLVAANLSVALTRLGMRVTLVDADLGAANQHTLFGLTNRGVTLHSFLEKDVGSLEEALVPTGVPRLNLLPGTSGVIGAAHIGHARKLKLVRHIAALDTEVVVIDCGAGVGNDVLDFTDLADLRVVVTTPQLTALQNAYAFLKGAVVRGFRHAARTRFEQERFDVASSRVETERLEPWLRRLDLEAPALVEHLRVLQQSWGGYVFGNLLQHDGERRVIDGLVRMVHDFLGVDLGTLGHLRSSAGAHTSVTQRQPLLVTEPRGEAARVLHAAAERLLTVDVRALRERRRRPPEGVPAERAPREASEPYEPRTSDPANEPEHLETSRLADHVRRHTRHPARTTVPLHVGERAADAELLDVSSGGARLRTSLELEAGDEVAFALDVDGRASRLAAVVRWTEGELVGVELRDPSDGRTLRVAAGLRPTSDLGERPADARAS
jgi:flagellar biosynthesis protein FlhG